MGGVEPLPVRGLEVSVWGLRGARHRMRRGGCWEVQMSGEGRDSEVTTNPPPLRRPVTHEWGRCVGVADAPPPPPAEGVLLAGSPLPIPLRDATPRSSHRSGFGHRTWRNKPGVSILLHPNQHSRLESGTPPPNPAPLPCFDVSSLFFWGGVLRNPPSGVPPPPRTLGGWLVVGAIPRELN